MLYVRLVGLALRLHIKHKLNEYTFRGSNSAIVISATLPNGGQLLKEKKIISFNRRPHLA